MLRYFVTLSVVCLAGSMFGGAIAQDVPAPLAAEQVLWPGPMEPVVISLENLPRGRDDIRAADGFRGIYSISRQGADVEFLLAVPGMLVNTDPAFSHDGKRLLLCGFPNLVERHDGRIFAADADAPMKGKLLDYGYGMTPDWSPDDKRIAYAINGGNPIGAAFGIWVMDADGANRRWLASGFLPRWSADGQQIAFQMFTAGGYTLALVDVADGTNTDLLAGTGWTLNSFGGNWSPDGKQIVFAGTRDGLNHLAIIDLSGDQPALRSLCASDAAQFKLCGPPAWSPDGKQIVFFAEEPRPNTPQRVKSYLFSMSAEVRCAPALLETERIGQINRAPAFSRDSKKILFSSER